MKIIKSGMMKYDTIILIIKKSDAAISYFMSSAGGSRKRTVSPVKTKALSLDPHIKTISFSVEGLVFRPAKNRRA
jgi:hypothetical protein